MMSSPQFSASSNIRELAQIIDSKETTVASWEQGKSLPSIDMLYRLAKYYNKTMDYMYGDEK